MKQSRLRRAGTCLVLLSGLPAGCAGLSDREWEPSFPPAVSATTTPAAAGPRTAAPPEVPKSIALASATAEGGAPGQLPAPAPLSGMSELTAEALIDQVLARNPTLAQMVAAWQAAAARYPQVTSLDDPMLGTTVAPAAVGRLGDGNRGYRVDLSQKLPWPGKLGLRGESARAETDAAGRDVDDTRLRLVESARLAFYEYYLVGRALDVNAEALRLLKEFRDNAETRYKTGMVPQQDILQADVEIGRQRERQVTLERMREVAVARINTLMHLPTNAPLPAPPKDLRPGGSVADVQALQATAVGRRPDLQALAARVNADQAAVALANKEFYPDFDVMAAYDPFWGEKQQQGQVGVRLNLPVRTSRRYGAVAEAQARLNQRRAELDRLRDQVNFQVQEAASQLRESERVVRLYEAEILPAAEANVKSAQSAYVTGKIPFLSLIESERNVVGLRDRYYEAVSDYYRRLAALERAVGGSVSLAPSVPGPTPKGDRDRK